MYVWKSYFTKSSDPIPENDTIRFYQKFYNYYAYDDGTAEEAYYLVGPAPSLAMKFVLNVTDTLRGIQMYFDPVVTNASTVPFRLNIWSATGGIPTGKVRRI